MLNKRMEEKVHTGEAVDLRTNERTEEGDFLLSATEGNIAEQGGVDFCDSSSESWIWSIGRSMGDGYVTMRDGTQRMLPKGSCVASFSQKFYQAEDRGWKCIWLR